MAENTTEKTTAKPIPHDVVVQLGTVPIKTEYLVHQPKSNAPESSNTEEPPKRIDARDLPKRIDARDQPNRKQHGNRKKRKRNKRQEAGFVNRKLDGVRLCFKLAHGTPCDLGEKCSFSHDIEAYFAAKPKDIGPVCPVFDQFGYCETGFRCRFAQSHIEKESDGVYKLLGDPEKRNMLPQLNVVDRDTRKLLRSNKYFEGKGIPKVLKVNGERKWTCVKCGNESNYLGSAEPCSKCAGSVRDCMPCVLPNISQTKESASSDTVTTPESNPTGSSSKPDTKSVDDSKSLPETDAVITRPVGVTESKEKPVAESKEQPVGITTFEQELKRINFDRKIYVAPLTTVGNLPFRRIVKTYGADITCGEMAMSQHLLSGHMTEWALTRRHPCEDVFGIQLAGKNEEILGNAARVIAKECAADFIDLNMGCPIDLVTDRGAGSKLMLSSGAKFMSILRSMTMFPGALPIGLKMRTGWNMKDPIAHKILPKVQEWIDAGCIPQNSIAYFSIHGRSRQQRYTKRADWGYIEETCNILAKARAESQFPSSYKPVPLMGNGDVMSYTEWEEHLGQQEIVEELRNEMEVEQVNPGKGDETNSPYSLSTCMLARGALVKPWLCTEIKERRHWDISASERFDMLKDFVKFGLEHWGTDDVGVNTTRRMLLEWISFLYRYVPVGLLEVVPQHIQDRPPAFVGRNDLETLLASSDSQDWIKISERLLGPVPEGFMFVPKHKANSYSDEKQL